MPHTCDGYRLFLRVKNLPTYSIRGRVATFPDEYAKTLGLPADVPDDIPYVPSAFLFDYQRDITARSIIKRKYCVFADCGLGKTLMFLEYAKYVRDQLKNDQCILIISPLMVIPQTMAEAAQWYGDDLQLRQVHSSELAEWLREPDAQIGITNYEALNDRPDRGKLACLIIDESSMLKSHYGKWGTHILNMGRGLKWKWAGTGTPAPNDRIEYANHAVFMDAFPNINAFLARYFVNRGQTSERWALKPHALAPFYKSLSHWCIFLNNPGTYGWKDHATDIPPIYVHIHDIPMTMEQHHAVQDVTGNLFASHSGGIGQRSKLGQISKGRHNGKNISTNKPDYIRNLIGSWPTESTLVWCIYNAEQEMLERALPEAGSLSGSIPYEERLRVINDFKAGRLRTLISKPKILGFGLNLQRATRQVFSGLQDSYESYYQAVKRSNRVGSMRPLNVHIPVTSAEVPMIETVLAKCKRVQEDTEQQEALFCECTR